MLKPMSSDDFEKGKERADMLFTFISSIDWTSVYTVMVEWADDSEIVEPTTFGQTEVTHTPATQEMITIRVVADVGTLPIPRTKDGKIEGEGVFI